MCESDNTTLTHILITQIIPDSHDTKKLSAILNPTLF